MNVQEQKEDLIFSRLSESEALLELYIARITFLTFEEKKIFKKNLDSSYSLVLLSIEDIEKLINHSVSKRAVWNAKENLRMAQVALHYCNQLGIKVLLHSDLVQPHTSQRIEDANPLKFLKRMT